MAIPVDTTGAGTFLNQLTQASAQSQRTSVMAEENRRKRELHNILRPVEQMKADEYAAPVAQDARMAKLQEALARAEEYVAPESVAARKSKTSLDQATAEAGLEILPSSTKKTIASNERQAARDDLGLETDARVADAEQVATATPQNWTKLSKALNSRGGYGFTGDWDKDAQARKALISSGMNNLAHRRTMDIQNVQLRLEEMRTKLPKIAQEAAFAFPDNPKAQQDAVAAYMQAQVAEMYRTGATAPKKNKPSPVGTQDLRDLDSVLSKMSEVLPALDGLSKEDRKAFKSNAASLAKKFQEDAAYSGGLSFTEAAVSAIQQLSTAVKNNEDTAWWRYDSETVYEPFSAESSASGNYGTFDQLLEAVSKPGGPSREEAMKIAEKNGWL